MPFVKVIELIIEYWWWFIVAIILYFPVKGLYKWWVSWDVFQGDMDWMVLEIIPPAEIEKPFQAMEDVFARLWTIYDGPVWRELWCQGEDYMAFWFSFEITSFGGEVHFYIRTLRGTRKLVEAVINAHYPDIEMFEVEDYTKNVPQDIPNEQYQVYGEDYEYQLDDLLPIRTYKYFEAAHPETIVGEKKIDPIYSLMEALTKLQKGEQFWFQMVCVPIWDEIPWVANGRKKVDELAKRPAKAKQPTMAGEAARLLFQAKVPYEEEKKEEFFIPPEMKLTPGERETLAMLEDKITKFGYKTSMRILYIAEHDKYFSPHNKIVRGYLAHFSTSRNYLMYWDKTRTRIHYFFRRRRLYKRRREIFDKYVKRLPPAFPNVKKGTSVLNIEELATVFHFPIKASILPPGVPRIVVRKREAPPGIPKE